MDIFIVLGGGGVGGRALRWRYFRRRRDASPCLEAEAKVETALDENKKDIRDSYLGTHSKICTGTSNKHLIKGLFCSN
jgi:hypothetical protein